MKNIALIDADGLFFRICTASSTEASWDDGYVYPYILSSLLLDSLEQALTMISHDTDAEELVLFFSGDSAANFRKSIDPTYKAHRTGRRPLGWDHAIDWASAVGYRCVEREIFEADDLVGAAYGFEDEEAVGRVVRVSEDKDLVTIPGRHYNPRKRDEGVVEVDRETADYNWLFQTLVGDRADGYPGCPRVGPVSAPPIAEAGWEAVVDAYISAGQTVKDALRNAQLARILRPGEIVNDQPVLWTPDGARTQGLDPETLSADSGSDEG
jgi:DNA polymerase-1